MEEQLHKMFPQARVLRMDADTTRTRESYEKILAAFARGDADILVGTQMIVKGHDFPAVTLVGVLAADLSLHISDYRAPERTFQLLTQAAGRAGGDAGRAKSLFRLISRNITASLRQLHRIMRHFFNRKSFSGRCCIIRQNGICWWFMQHLKRKC